MSQERDILRLINCLVASLILHVVFLLSLTPQLFLNLAGGSRHPHVPMTVRLAPLSAIALPATDPSTQQPAPAPSVPSSTNAPASAYHSARELSRMPEMIGQPPEAIEVGQDISGEVVFRLSIDRLGKVKLLQSLKSTLPREVEGKLAMQLYNSQYRAGEINGIAVESEMTVDLRLESGGWLTDKLPVLRPAQQSPQGASEILGSPN
jgi:hypothetical protein